MSTEDFFNFVVPILNCVPKNIYLESAIVYNFASIKERTKDRISSFYLQKEIPLENFLREVPND